MAKMSKDEMANKLAKMQGEITKRSDEFARMLPKGWTVERFVAQARLALVKQTKLLEVEPSSVVMGLYQCAELGLQPAGGLGHGWLIPYGAKAQWVTGYKGLIFLATKARIVKSVHTACVYEHEDKAGLFHHDEGLARDLKHKVLAPPGDDAPHLIAAYMTMLLDDGQRDFHVMYRHKLIERRNRSSGYKTAVQYKRSDNPWMTDFDAMCMKTVIRDGLKNVPMTADSEWTERLSRAFEREDNDITDAEFEDGGEDGEVEEKPAKGTKMDRLANQLVSSTATERLEQPSTPPKVGVPLGEHLDADSYHVEPPDDVVLPIGGRS